MEILPQLNNDTTPSQHTHTHTPNHRHRENCHLPNIWEFVYFVCGLSPPKHRVVRWQNFAHRHMMPMCRTCAGFYVYMGLSLRNYDIFPKNMQVAWYQFAAVASGQSVVPQAVGLYQPAGWLSVYSNVCRYSDVAGVSQSDWPLRVQ